MAPLLVFLMAYLFAGELLSGLGAVAVIAVSLGILLLALPSGPGDTMSGKATLAAMATSVLIACYTLVDGLGGRSDGEVLRYISWLFLLEGFPLTVVVLLRRRPRELRSAWRLVGRNSVIGGLLSTGAYALVIWAMSIAPMTAVSALRESSVIFAALIGSYRMRERMGPRRIAASVVVTLGIVLLQLAGRS